MTTAPVLLIDFCGVQDKDVFVDRLGAGLAPRELLVLGGPTLGARVLAARHALRRMPPSEHALRHARLLAERRARVSPGTAARRVRAAHELARRTIRRVRPALVLVWNAFHPLSRAALDAVEEASVPVAYLEYGLLPSTISFDFRGQMGESRVSVDAAAFDALPIDARDLTRARTVVADLRRSEKNRRRQPPRRGLDGELRRRAGGRPVVLFAGHNDHSSGVAPWDDRAKELHSPIFASSADAARALEAHARREGWLLVYKPHPFARRAQSVPETDALVCLDDANINECVDAADAVVTVLSQVSYIALVREKPVVMLGYNQLRDKGCTYDAHALDAVAPAIAEALAHGLTAAQREAWIAHVARLLRHYLFDYSRPGGPAIGRPVEELAAVIERAIRSGRFVDFDQAETSAERPDGTNITLS